MSVNDFCISAKSISLGDMVTHYRIANDYRCFNHGIHHANSGRSTLASGHESDQWLPVPGRRHGLVQPFCSQLELSNTLETGFCLAALHAAFRFGQPEIWNSD